MLIKKIAFVFALIFISKVSFAGDSCIFPIKISEKNSGPTRQIASEDNSTPVVLTCNGESKQYNNVREISEPRWNRTLFSRDENYCTSLGRTRKGEFMATFEVCRSDDNQTPANKKYWYSTYNSEGVFIGGFYFGSDIGPNKYREISQIISTTERGCNVKVYINRDDSRLIEVKADSKEGCDPKN